MTEAELFKRAKNRFNERDLPSSGGGTTCFLRVNARYWAHEAPRNYAS